ncbi:GNAT family N-acetyltransferase [Nakamurella sp. A5-74]|uniref:GNAT family N-acetyltransferase n=1 Tax=Nakamurella sp. A5-74 TaxID=3158264 RepID=A0AAU8DL31_9ACTN
MPAAKKPTRPSARSAPAAPHLLEPKLTRVTARSHRAFHEAIARGFQEPIRPEVTELDKKLAEHDRFFGFTVDGRWIATCGSFTRTLTVPGGAAIPVAAVTNVTVQGPFHRRGLLRRMMQHQLEDVAARGESLSVLWASEASIYGRFGYAPAASRSKLSGTSARLQFLPGVSPAGSVDEVDQQTFLDAAVPLHAAWRSNRPGNLDRPGSWWDHALFDAEFHRDGAGELRHLLHFDQAGDVDGYATYRFKGDWSATGPDGEIRIGELAAGDTQAYAGLWRYLLDVDLARSFTLNGAPVDAPLRHLVTDARAIRTEISDNLYLRVVDVAAALAARTYRTDFDVVLQVSDPLLAGNNGRFRVRGGPAGATVTRARGAADLELGILELGAVYLGGVSLELLHRSGRIREHTPGSASATSLAFGSDLAPFCPDHF